MYHYSLLVIRPSSFHAIAVTLISLQSQFETFPPIGRVLYFMITINQPTFYVASCTTSTTTPTAGGSGYIVRCMLYGYIARAGTGTTV